MTELFVSESCCVISDLRVRLRWRCEVAACVTELLARAAGHRNILWVLVKSKEITARKFQVLYVLHQSTNVCTNIPECRLQMVNLVISQQLGENGKEHNGFIKKDVCCTKLGCVSDETVCLCCAMPCVRHPILFCVREGLQLHFFLFFLFMAFVPWLIQPKTRRERERD